MASLNIKQLCYRIGYRGKGADCFVYCSGTLTKLFGEKLC